MTNSKKFLFAALISLIVYTLCIPATSFALPEKILLACGEWPPYTSEDLEGGGFANVIVKEALAAMGHEIQVEFLPWTRAMAYVEKHTVLGSFPWAAIKARKTKFCFTAPLFFTETKFFYNKKKMQNVAWLQLEDLKKYRIGAVQDYNYIPALQDAGIEFEMIMLHEKSGFKMLMLGGIDLFPSGDIVGWEIIKKVYPGREAEFGTLKKGMGKNFSSVMCSRSNPEANEFIKMFNKGLMQIKKNGTYKQILDKYGYKEF